MEQERGPLIGVLAIQGAVSEHVDVVEIGARAVEIRYPNQILQPEASGASSALENTAMSIERADRYLSCAATMGAGAEEAYVGHLCGHDPVVGHCVRLRRDKAW